ncbi:MULTISPECIES: hypothetical protein [Rhizobium]|uniref:Uncharacterized protein n=1 Tax=Rhizobium leguminosarum bv. viciae TaxID=387 RepID=A0A8G2J210_RHILV|nr:hypothetical protein [Rhizobium leguminosarum]MBY5390429.1 hypothetical protein [Rhizobium leguminosarum]MBY5432552.1 hypothetical protein [Rhizobium leguminosarum]NEI58867.1 hypothetical protein [Rhizobium leguminosarum]NEI87747.1 hypothetical protein [Rhizobium leguminosarum]NEK43550.1 hypothetical protein [Rhizobium leguminosarum]
MNYEYGMTVFYDPVTKNVIVVFRGETTILEGPFQELRTGITAGEKLCEELGWRSGIEETPDKSTD